jgi:alkanesulfonate monooxygenase SsuD/methylene tetrahydromethanopterin reductase-like flavin-dependent oxidoreductase (luciferase family)
MKIGIGLPTTHRNANGKLILDWARQADTGPFSSLGLIDRLVYHNFESLITLGAVAGVTQRIRLMTTILITPLRQTGILAKQSASLDALSGGRLTLGLGIGGREDDFLAAPAPFRNRGKHFEKQLNQMTHIWSGQPLNDNIGPIGPAPAQSGGPEILLGAYSPTAIQRIGRWGNGFITGGAGPEMALQTYTLAVRAWNQAGRSGKPRLVACSYYGLGPQSSEHIRDYINDYYAFMGPQAQQIVEGIPGTPEAIRVMIKAFTDIGADELILWPCIADIDQIHRLTDIVAHQPV